MPQINVSVPPALKEWLDGRVAEGRYSSSSDYVRSLIREDEIRSKKVANLQAAIDKGRASGPGRDFEEFFADLRHKRQAAA
jgi:antitoxin ParD1/3/4